MKKITTLLMLAMLCGACSKNSTPVPAPSELIFGVLCPLCFVNTHNYYQIKDNALYQDTNHMYSPLISFPSTPLASSKYEAAKVLMQNIPDYLLVTDSGNVGNAGYIDGEILHLEITTNKGIKKWDINPDTTVLPGQIKAYIGELNRVLTQIQ